MSRPRSLPYPGDGDPNHGDHDGDGNDFGGDGPADLATPPAADPLIGGVEYEAKLFEDDVDNKSASEFVHQLRTPRGRWFDVFTRDGVYVPRPERNWCERCSAHHCHHLDALVDLNLMCD